MSAVIAAAAIDGMTDCAAAFMPSTPQWIACEGLGRTWDLPGIGGASRCGQLGHDFDLHVAVLQLPLVVLLEHAIPDLRGRAQTQGGTDGLHDSPPEETVTSELVSEAQIPC